MCYVTARGGATATTASAKSGTATAAAAPARGDRTTQNAARKREREVARLEGEIATRETRIQALEGQLADPALYHDATRSRDIVAEYERLRSEVESLWQRLAELG